MPLPERLRGLQNAAHLSAIRRTAQERVLKNLYNDADASNAQLIALSTAIRNACAGDITAIPGPVKGEARARQKTAWDYSGDFYDLKDVVRMTLIAGDSQGLDRVRTALRSYCVPSNGYSIIKDQETRPNFDECGYSGLNFVVRLPNGRAGEIQANIPVIMYGKMSKASFCRSLGEKEHARIQTMYHIEGGLGHGLYEIFRTNRQGLGRSAAMLSKLYYAYLRSPPNIFRQRELEQRIPRFKATFPDIFGAH